MASPKLKVEKRKILGRKVKQLRRDGILPANIYGKKTKSLAVQVQAKDFLAVYKQAGETNIIDLAVGGETKPRAVLITNLYRHPVTNETLHADFRQVVLTEKAKVGIPVELVGEAPAVVQKKGILVQMFDELEVEALPKNLPDKLLVDISGLGEVDDAVLVKDIKVDKKKVNILVDDNQIVVKIEPPTKEEEIEKPPEEMVEEEAPGEKLEAKPGEKKEEKEEEEKKKPEKKARPEEKK